MGRDQVSIYKNPKTGIYFARFYEGKKQYRLSLGTKDYEEALQRFPVVRQAKVSYNEYKKSLDGINTLVMNKIGNHQIIPGFNIPLEPTKAEKIIGSAVALNKGYLHPQGWILSALESGLPTDSTAMHLDSLPASDVIFRGLETIRSSMVRNDWNDINNFYGKNVLELYRDKVRAARFSCIFLKFLKESNIISWVQITEDLMIKFKEWRKTTPIASGTNLKCKGKPPSNAIINQHIKFLEKTFHKAIALQKMTGNPVYGWKQEEHEKRVSGVLTLDEFKRVLKSLTGPVRQVVILLFAGCKRRKEITSLYIEDIDFEKHFVHYTEWKNKGKKGIDIKKAFHVTPCMENFLRTIIDGRTPGKLWPDLTPDYVSNKYEEAVEALFPGRNTTLKNIRQLCTATMQKAGLTAEERDFTLHNTVTERFYEDPDTKYERLAEKTKPGIEVLSKAVEEYLV